MKRKRRNHSASFKAKVAVATAIRELTATVSAILANPKDVEFSRNSRGDITSARIKL